MKVVADNYFRSTRRVPLSPKNKSLSPFTCSCSQCQIANKISVCGARYKTRPGLTYHYSHSHKEGASDENSRDSTAPAPQGAATPAPGGEAPTVAPQPNPGHVYQDSYVSFLNHPAGTAYFSFFFVCLLPAR